MFEKCPTCGSRIVAGGRRFVKWTFCSEKCESQFKIALAERLLSPAELARRVRQVYEAACPLCHRSARNHLVSTTRVTGMLVAYRVDKRKHICCVQCARKKMLLAVAHCLTFGWWSFRAAFVNVFILAANLLGLFYLKELKGPSVALTAHVKMRIAEELAPQLHAAAKAQRRAVSEQEFAGDEGQRA
jgi:hypothetical protein